MASTALLPLLLCGASALRQQPEAFYADNAKAGEDSQGCVEPTRFLTDDMPDESMSLERREGLATDQDAEFQEYMYNLSHVRVCNSMRDNIDFLGALVVPRLKLAFCYVPKVACSQFKDLFNNMNELPKSFEGFGHHYLSSVRWQMHVRKEEISKENGWKFATFLRDPALRYLSAFGSTCVATNKLGMFEHKFECCGPLVFNNRLSKPEFVNHFRARLFADVKDGVVKNDDHWVSQTQILQQCGWQWFSPEHLDFQGYLAGDVNGQVKSMLKLVNYTNDTLVDRLFPKENIAGHRSPIHFPPEATALSLIAVIPGLWLFWRSHKGFYDDRDAVDAIKSIYEDDYINFPGVGCAFTDRMEKKHKRRKPKRTPPPVKRPPKAKPVLPTRIR